MAVLLCRSDGKPFPTPPPLEMRGLPRIIVDYEPLPEHSSYQGKQIATRTESHYACLDQPREEFFQDTYDRCKMEIFWSYICILYEMYNAAGVMSS